MLQALPYPIRQQCPPGACVCGRDALLDALAAAPETDVRILRLTRDEEKRLIVRIEAIASYQELQHMTLRMDRLLGLAVRITPSVRGVRTVRGLAIELAERPGLCRKTRQAIPAAIRRCLERHPDIVYALLNARDLLGDA
jgi:hypothetical protein